MKCVHTGARPSEKLAMHDRDLVLTLAREARSLRISLDERDGVEKTLRFYEIKDVDWGQVQKACDDIFSILNRSNKSREPNSQNRERLKRSGHLLFDLLISPTAKGKLSAADARTLTLDLDESLVFIPWELLYDGEEFLCRRFSMGRSTRTRQTPTMASSRKLRAPFKVLILADPGGDLPEAYREGLEIKAFLDERRNSFEIDFQSAPVDRSFVQKSLRDYDIVHYAGHAVYRADSPSESGWTLKDGTLTAREITAMGGLQPLPALVFANACQSGHSEERKAGDEICAPHIFGLANAYLLTGVQHYVGTLWDVLDAPSREFAKRFYDFLARGESIGNAVRQARGAISDAYGEERICWASYVLYGDPTATFYSMEQPTPVKQALPPPKISATDWQQATRGHTPSLPSEGRPRRLIGRYSSLVLILSVFLLGFFGYNRLIAERRGGPEIASRGALDTGEAAVALAGAVITPATRALSLSMSLIGQRKEADGSYTEVVVSEGSVLRSYDNFQVHLETDRPAYAYVLIYDSEGKASQLFPDPKIDQPGFLEAGKPTAIPGKDLWFWLDENTGTETIYVLASEQPMSDMQDLLRRMETADEGDRNRLSGDIRKNLRLVQRGVGGVGKGKRVTYPLSDGRRIQKVTEVVSGSGAVVRAISFHHR